MKIPECSDGILDFSANASNDFMLNTIIGINGIVHNCTLPEFRIPWRLALLAFSKTVKQFEIYDINFEL